MGNSMWGDWTQSSVSSSELCVEQRQSRPNGKHRPGYKYPRCSTHSVCVCVSKGEEQGGVYASTLKAMDRVMRTMLVGLDLAKWVIP